MIALVILAGANSVRGAGASLQVTCKMTASGRRYTGVRRTAELKRSAGKWKKRKDQPKITTLFKLGIIEKKEIRPAPPLRVL